MSLREKMPYLRSHQTEINHMNIGGKKIIITADRSLMSDYQGSMFFGFSACITDKLFPDYIRHKTSTPKLKSNADGTAKVAPLGVRKIEAALLRDGFYGEVVVVHPNQLDKIMERAKLHHAVNKIIGGIEFDDVLKNDIRATNTRLSWALARSAIGL